MVRWRTWTCAVLLPLFAVRDEVAVRPDYWRALETIAAEHGKTELLTVVLDHLAEMTRTRQVPGRSPRVLEVLAHPWKIEALGRDLLADLSAPLAADVFAGPEFFAALRAWTPWQERENGGELDPSLADSREALEEIWAEIADPSTVEEGLLERLSELMAEAHHLLERGLAHLDDAERELLFTGHVGFSEAWYRSHFPDAPLAADLGTHLAAYQRVILQIDRAPVLAVAEVLARLFQEEFLATLGKRLARTSRERLDLEGLDGDIVRVIGADPASRVILGGSRRSSYDLPAALVIDLGGNDSYGRCAVANDPSSLASVVLDLKGDDRYEAEIGPAYSVAGVAMLLDRRGDDTYRSKRHGQSCSAAGFALLVDEDGDDVYEAEDYVQGYSFCGYALLYDRDGDDRYTAHAYAQGAGNGMAVAALVDAAGDDQYLADLHWPDVYGDSGPNVFHGASQGYSTGFRGSAGNPQMAGGFSALIDVEGVDRYQSGNFSQGGGYFFGFGLMYDGGGDDENVGTRYSQGFGVHQALGMRWDAAGNDTYRTRTAANCGSAWDEGVGLLLDEAGNDDYGAGSLALGGAAQTAVALLVDRGGEDLYRSANGAGNQGGAGSSDYHDKPSIALLIDAGGDHDEYSRPGREDGALIVEEGGGVFLDLKGKTIEAWLEDH